MALIDISYKIPCKICDKYETHDCMSRSCVKCIEGHPNPGCVSVDSCRAMWIRNMGEFTCFTPKDWDQ